MPVDSSRSQPHPGLGAGATIDDPPSHLERARIYQWLGGVFARELALEALAAYRSTDGMILLDGFGSHAALAPLVAELRTLALAHESPETAATDLAGAFSRLFLGVGGRHSAPPYESAYTSERGLLFQEASGHSAAQLLNLGLHVSQSFSEPPDHLAVQLEIMAELARRAEESQGAAETARYADRQLAFLEDRLLPWIGAFRDDCVASDRSGFYATAATCLVDFVREDAKRLRAGGA